MTRTDLYGAPVKEVDPVHGTDYVTGDERPRCTNIVGGKVCNALLAEFVTRPWRIKCRRCKAFNSQPVPNGGPTN